MVCVTSPRLDHLRAPSTPTAVVLLLHGGKEHSHEPVRNHHASWWRMRLMASSLKRQARRQEWALALLQYRVRGWNDPADPSPVADAREALDQLSSTYPGLPIVLVGHSMGGRTACRVADHDAVVGVVGLAPWLPDGEPNVAMRDRALRILHGDQDTWTSPELSLKFAQRSADLALSAAWSAMPGAGHFMFRRPWAWNRFVKQSVADMVEQAPQVSEASNEGSA